MNEIIIINCVHNKESRTFTEQYRNNSNVIVLEDCDSVRMQYPYISAFPTVIIPTPEYQITGSQGDIETVPSSIEYLRAPSNWQEVQNRIDYWNSFQ